MEISLLGRTAKEKEEAVNRASICEDRAKSEIQIVKGWEGHWKLTAFISFPYH